MAWTALSALQIWQADLYLPEFQQLNFIKSAAMTLPIFLSSDQHQEVGTALWPAVLMFNRFYPGNEMICNSHITQFQEKYMAIPSPFKPFQGKDRVLFSRGNQVSQKNKQLFSLSILHRVNFQDCKNCYKITSISLTLLICPLTLIDIHTTIFQLWEVRDSLTEVGLWEAFPTLWVHTARVSFTRFSNNCFKSL